MAKLVAEAWGSFDRPRPEEPPLDERVRAILQAGLPLDPVSVHEALDDAARALDESIAQPRPRYFAFIGSSGLEIGALGDLLAATYDMNLAVDARAATVLEQQAVRWVGEFIGYPARNGAFTSGGTISNMTALAAARERALPGSRAAGLGGLRVALYASSEVHYSITRAVELLGIGSDRLRDVPIDDEHRMRADLLAEAIDRDVADGVTPVAVIATAGTTLTGAIDPVGPIADVCEARGIWLHVDGAYGAPAVLAGAVTGLGVADSLVLDPHKWLFQPYEIGCLLIREPGLLERTFSLSGAYLRDTISDEVNFRDRSVQLTRTSRALKLWLSIRVFGVAAFRGAIAHGIALAEHAEAVLRARPGWEVVSPAQLAIVCFRREGVDQTALAAAMVDDGYAAPSTTELDGRVVLRLCTINPRTTFEDIERTIQRMEALAGSCA